MSQFLHLYKIFKVNMEQAHLLITHLEYASEDDKISNE